MIKTGATNSLPEKKILIVEDHPVVREGIIALLKAEADLSVCGQATNAHQVKELAQSTSPDLILLDLVLGSGDGLELIKELRTLLPDCKILILTMHEEMTYAQRALKAGARGYIMKHEASNRIIAAIKGVLNGEIFVSSKVAGSFMKQSFIDSTKESKQGLDSLSDRELHVFQSIGSGKTTRQIAQQLGISVKTVESHRENIKYKLSLENSTSLVRAATLWCEEQHR